MNAPEPEIKKPTADFMARKKGKNHEGVFEERSLRLLSAKVANLNSSTVKMDKSASPMASVTEHRYGQVTNFESVERLNLFTPNWKLPQAPLPAPALAHRTHAPCSFVSHETPPRHPASCARGWQYQLPVGLMLYLRLCGELVVLFVRLPPQIDPHAPSTPYVPNITLGK